jgi:hypothetical protein
MKIKKCPVCGQLIHKSKKRTTPQQTPQQSYYQRNKEKIKAKLAEKRQDPEYRKKHNEAAKRSYYKIKSQRNGTEDQI